MRPVSFAPLLVPLALLLAACSSTGPTAEVPGPAVVKEPIKDIAWKDMSKPERGAYMKNVVMPAMKEVFVAFDPKYGEFTCATCHSKASIADHSFEMPNPDILVLPATHEGFEALGKEKGAWMKFMGEQVKPKMAELLGLSQWEPNNPTGFGCYGCHAMQSAP